MATARRCDGRRKISASKRWLFVKCKYLEAVEVENMEEPPECIVEHPGFQAVCLNYWVFRAAWQHKQQYGALEYEESDHKKSRHIAYRQLVRWYWGSLSRDIGVTLLSLIPVQLSAYDLISRSLKGWRMWWSSQDSIVQGPVVQSWVKITQGKCEIWFKIWKLKKQSSFNSFCPQVDDWKFQK